MTELLVVLSLVVTLAIVLVLVGYLLAIIYVLWTSGTTLKNLAGGLVAVRDNTQPLPDDIPAINGALATLLESLLKVNGNLAAIVKVAQGKT
ncbi:MAG: hypothetical protein K0U34_05965 [Alphaproteobacteria bacterium]|nr:hypothetical protein [Alphaproteobacteria bacterium]